MIITERDLRLLRWVNGWGAVTVAQVAVWLLVDFSTAARRVRKLIEGGFLRRLPVSGLTVQPVAMTKLGCEAANDPLRPLAGIRVATWPHDSKMVDLEARILQRFPDGVLHPDRRIRSNRKLEGSSFRHVPDAELERAGSRPIAIELELSKKAPDRLQAIIDGYVTDRTYVAVFYLSDDEDVARYVSRFTEGLRDFVKVQLVRPHSQTHKEANHER
jgi:hypothetical protein